MDHFNLNSQFLRNLPNAFSHINNPFILNVFAMQATCQTITPVIRFANADLQLSTVILILQIVRIPTC